MQKEGGEGHIMGVPYARKRILVLQKLERCILNVQIL